MATGTIVRPESASYTAGEYRLLRAAGIIYALAWELSLGVYLIVKGFKTSSPLIDTRHTEAPQVHLPRPALATQ